MTTQEIRRGFESFSAQVDDDGDPRTALDIAGQAVRDFNHRTGGPMRRTRRGWRGAPDAYRALGELTYLAGGLPQAFQQITEALEGEVAAGLIAIDWGGDAGAAVETAADALDRAIQAAHVMYRAIADAQIAINAASYCGPDAGDPPPDELC